MKKFIFIVTLISGTTFTQAGEGYNVSEALMDACDVLARTGNYPEEDIDDINLYNQEEA